MLPLGGTEKKIPGEGMNCSSLLWIWCFSEENPPTCAVVERSDFLLFLHLFPSVSNQSSFASCLSSDDSAFNGLIIWVLRKPGTESLLADKA